MKKILFFLILSGVVFGQNSVKDSLVTDQNGTYTITIFKFGNDVVMFPRTDNENKFTNVDDKFELSLSPNIKLSVYQKQGSKWEMEQQISPGEFKKSKCIENTKCSKDFLKVDGIPTLYMYNDFYKENPKITTAQFLYYLSDKVIALELSSVQKKDFPEKTDLFKEFNKIGVERFIIKEN